MLSFQLCRSSQAQVKMGVKRMKSIEFNLSSEYYGNLIPQIRNMAKQGGRFSHNRPVLPEQPNGEPQDWLEMKLSSTEYSIHIMIRLDNLYLVGYRSETGSWMEFDRKDNKGKDLDHLIPGAEFLGFDGSYPALGIPCWVSRDSVLGAVNKVGNPNTDRSSIKKELALFIMVICEATRFEEMSRRFAQVMVKTSTQPPPKVVIEAWMLDLFTSWGDLSGKLLRADADGDQYFRFPSNTNPPLKDKIKSALEAAEYLALLCGPKYRHASTLANNFTPDYIPRGQPMMELLWVHIPDFTGVVSGTITVKDGLGPQNLFSRTQVIRKLGDTLILDPLQRAISAWQCVDIDYNLTSAQSQYCGTYSWDIFKSVDLYVDHKNSSSNYATRSSSTDNVVWINMGLFMEAYQIIWKVKIANGDGYNPMNVYGSVNLSCSVGTFNYNVNLFSRSSDECELVYVGGDVPLLRKAMAVPLDMDVTLDVNLWDYILDSSPRCIAQTNLSTRFGSNDAARDQFHILNFGKATQSHVEISYKYNVVSMD